MSSLVVTPTLSDVYNVLQPFIVTITGLDPSLVIQGLPNRTPMPEADPGFVTMQAILTKRLRTNVDGGWSGVDDPTGVNSEQGTLLRVQLDVYGVNSGDWAVMLSTLLRDEYGCAQLAGLDGEGNPVVPPLCQPLYVDDAKLAPLVDTEDQYEQRWIVEAILQFNPVTTTPMQFANTAEISVINVDEAYPP